MKQEAELKYSHDLINLTANELNDNVMGMGAVYVPVEKTELWIKGLVGHGRKMEQQVIAELSPANLAQEFVDRSDSICLFAFRRLSGVPHLPG